MFAVSECKPCDCEVAGTVDGDPTCEQVGHAVVSDNSTNISNINSFRFIRDCVHRLGHYDH